MYAETCAALGSMFWNWEMSLLTQEAAYADLFERQLYNASLVGIGQQGICYLYNNPLESQEGMQRQPWFEIPCCPSNISRTWGKLGGYLCSYQTNQIWIHQLIGAKWSLPLDSPVSIQSESELPWYGNFSVHIHTKQTQQFALHLRVPSWTEGYRVLLNQQEIRNAKLPTTPHEATAHGYDPRKSTHITIDREWKDGDTLTLELEMPIQFHKVHPKVKRSAGKFAIARGPLVYCLEAIDNPGIDLTDVKIRSDSLEAEFLPELLGGIMTLKGKSPGNLPVRFIPYAWWANREACPMTVFVELEN